VTGYRSRHFRYDCERRGCYVQSLPSWDDLIDECFPRGIRPTDVDGLVEINGHILVLEEKGEGVFLEEGQRKALASLATREDVTVIYMRPKGNQLGVLELGSGKDWQYVTRAQFKDWLRWWCSNAERAPA